MLISRASNPFSLSVKPMIYVDGTRFTNPGNGNQITSGIINKVDGSTTVGTYPRAISGTSIAVVNGQQVMNFTSDNSRFKFAGITLPSNWSVAAVEYRESSLNNFFFVEHGPDTNSNDGMYLYGGGTGMIMSRQNGGGLYTNQSDATWRGSAAQFYTRVGTCQQGVEHKCYLNGTVVTPASTSGAWGAAEDVTDTMYVGARSTGALQFYGRLLFFALYPGVLSTADRQKIERYLRLRFRHY